MLGGDTRRIGVHALVDRRYDETNWWKSRCGVKSLMLGVIELAFAVCRGENYPNSGHWDPDRYERALRQTAEEAAR